MYIKQMNTESLIGMPYISSRRYVMANFERPGLAAIDVIKSQDKNTSQFEMQTKLKT